MLRLIIRRLGRFNYKTLNKVQHSIDPNFLQSCLAWFQVGTRHRPRNSSCSFFSAVKSAKMFSNELRFTFIGIELNLIIALLKIPSRARRVA